MAKFICGDCDWHGQEEEILTAPNPFTEDDNETMFGCPTCREPNTMRVACDEPGCWQSGTCGTNTPKGYRTTCYEHRPKERAA